MEHSTDQNGLIASHPPEKLTSASLEQRRDAWLDTVPTLEGLYARELWTNLRLRWTCHSNAFDGNSLTYRDTSLLLLFGRTAGQHLIREYDKVRGHDAAIEAVRIWVDQRQLAHPRGFVPAASIAIGSWSLESKSGR